MQQEIYPKEYMVELEASSFLVGRITLYKQGARFNVEIDIVQKESGKIFKHVKSLYNEEDQRDAVDISMHHLKEFLDRLKH